MGCLFPTMIHSSVKRHAMGKQKLNQRMNKQTCVKKGILANFTEKNTNSQNVCLWAGVLHIHSTS